MQTPATTDQLERYSNGRCYRLAQAIADLTGWTLVAVLDTWTVSGALYSRGHIAVRHPDGHLLDVSGLHTDGEIAAEWDADTITTLDHISDLPAQWGWGWIPTRIDRETADLAAAIVAAAQ